ncbi:hypothetical protein OH77DRAFT_1524159 [Trametes cingulata]|nr:hypothetical protein OH77DRAFT_1524159 [Trametes cingulata]
MFKSARIWLSKDLKEFINDESIANIMTERYAYAGYVPATLITAADPGFTCHLHLSSAGTHFQTQE